MKVSMLAKIIRRPHFGHCDCKELKMMANAVDVGRRTTNKIGCRIAISKLASFSCRFIFQSSIGN
jgi:hypothetical protein